VQYGSLLAPRAPRTKQTDLYDDSFDELFDAFDDQFISVSYYKEQVPAKLPDVMKSLVIQQWLGGVPRDEIAYNNNLSAGAVTNIVNEWRRSLGLYTADELRELATTLRKLGITPAQCALGSRTAMIMINLGVKEDSFEEFILDVYNRCKDLGLSSENIASHLRDMLGFSKTGAISLSGISDYVKQKADEKGNLEIQKGRLKQLIETLQQEKSDAEANTDVALKNEMMTAGELKWYSDLKAELGKYGVPIDDISKLAPIVIGISQSGYEVDKVLQAFSDVDSLAAQHKLYYGMVQELENKVNGLKQQCSLLEQMANSHSQTISTYKMLEVMGFGLKELTLLYHTINEIVDANNIHPDQAQHKFYKDIEDQYDNKLGFEPKVNELRFELSKLGQDINRLRSELFSMPLVGSAIIGLIRSGLKEQDIIKLAEMFEGYRRSGGGIDTQLLTAELEKYGGIRLAIQKRKQELDNLDNRLASLQARKEALEKDMKRMLSSLAYSRQAVDFLQGMVASLRNEMAGLVSIIGYIGFYLLKLQSEEERIRKFDGLDEFVPLIRSYKGESVPKEELKISVTKVIEVAIRNRINEKVTEILSKARDELMN
jgi:hypothetical protein